MRKIYKIEFFNFPLIFGVLILLLNDFYLKEHFHNILTGKLSDFAGLFSFSIFLGLLFPNYKKGVFVLIGFSFIFWKSQFSDGLINYWNSLFNFQIGRIIDSTDLVALTILPYAFTVKLNPIRFQNPILKKGFSFLVIVISLFSFIATAGTHGKIKAYKFDYSKYEVNQAIKLFFVENPELIVPDSLQNHTWHYVDRDTKDERFKAMNADTVSFHFFIKNEKGMYWASFIGNQDDWNISPCDLALIYYYKNYEIISQDSENSEEIKMIEKYFKENIISEINSILIENFSSENKKLDDEKSNDIIKSEINEQEYKTTIK